MTIRLTSSRPTALHWPGLASLFVAFALVGCGGGGSSDSSNPPPEPSPPPVVVPDPPPVPPPVVSKGNVSLLAGTIAGVGNLDGTGAAARFNQPRGVALDAQGNLYVADRYGHRIRKVMRDGVVTTLAGSGLAGYDDGASGVATFCGPTDVAVDADHNVFVVDNVVVRKVSADGIVTTVAGKAPPICNVTEGFAPPKFPSAVAVDRAGNLYITNALPAEVYRLTPSGELSRLPEIDATKVAGPAPPFGQLFGIAVDLVGNIYVAGPTRIGASAGPPAVRKITPDGVVSTVVVPADSGLLLTSLTADRNGALYFADLRNQSISTLSASGEIKQVATGIQTGSFAVDADGSIWFVQNDTIRRIDPFGRVIDIAGQAEPFEPRFIGNQAADSAGNVYVLAKLPPGDISAVLQRIAPDGSTITLLDDLNTPQGMAVDAQDNVYLASLVQIGTTCGYRGMCGIPVYGSEVTKLDTQGRVTKLPRTFRDAAGNEIGLDRVSALALDRAGDLYVADSQFEKTAIYRITPAGTISPVAAGKFRVSDLASDSQGNVYAPTCDLVNYPTGAQIVRYGADGTATPLAGSVAVVSGAADGMGSQARFGSCRLGIALDRNDRIYVADTENHTVRRVSATGQVSTVVGRAGLQGITLGELPASLSAPVDLSFDGAGNMYVSSLHAVLKVRLPE